MSNPLKTPHTTLQDHTSPTYPIRTQPYSTCCPTPFHNNRAHTMHTWERIHTSLKLSSTYNRPHLVSDGLPRYSSQSLLLDNAHSFSTNMARRVGLSKTNNKFGKQTLYSTHIYLCFCFCYCFLFPTVYIDCHPQIPAEETIKEGRNVRPGLCPNISKHYTILRIFYL